MSGCRKAGLGDDETEPYVLHPKNRTGLPHFLSGCLEAGLGDDETEPYFLKPKNRTGLSHFLSGHPEAGLGDPEAGLGDQDPQNMRGRTRPDRISRIFAIKSALSALFPTKICTTLAPQRPTPPLEPIRGYQGAYRADFFLIF